jgi:hypothetical protein
MVRVQCAVPLTLDGGSYYGDQEESEEGSEETREKEEEESCEEENSEEEGSKEIRQKEGGQEETRKKESSQEEGCQEEDGQEEKGEASCETGCACDGSGGSGPVHRGSARGKDCPEPRSSLAVSDRLKALAGLRMNCGQLGAHPELIRKHSTDDRFPALLPNNLILSGARAVMPGIFFRIAIRQRRR